jgi:hypothetical protein
MRSLRLVAPLLVAVGLGVAACGGGSSAGSSAAASTSASAALSTSAAPSTSASTSVAAAGGSGDAAFCAAFSTLKTEGDALVAENARSQLQDLAKKLKSTAPSDIKDDATTLANFYLATADAATGAIPSVMPSEPAGFALAAEHIAIWTETHCTSS